uniref:WAT1-related protein At1g68170-like n=1 Tax=Erigeron canadensis TaxID=72917 RepID=UPI001CB8AE19|nr:WAT1-related protein At1g68170-like [Erigeron canadensis]
MGASKSSYQENKMQRLKAALMMIVADLIIAGFNVSYKVASHDGMHMSVLITYRYLFALICLSPFVLFAIRRGPMSQNLYAKGLVLTSATFASAFSNLIPPFTFVIAVLLRLEKVELGKISGKAKVVGTLVAVGGATLLTFYKGQQLNLWSTHFSLLNDDKRISGQVAAARTTSTQHIIGSILAMGSALSYGLYLNLQVNTHHSLIS